MAQPARWVITGGTGFLGTNLLHALTEADGEVVVIARDAPRWPVLRPGIRYVDQDVREVASYQDELTPGSIVVHMASSTYPGRAEKTMESDIQDNVISTIRLANACIERGVRSFVFLSSGGAIYGPQSVLPIPENVPLSPMTAYGVMKLTIEQYLRVLNVLHGMPTAILRVSNPFGPWHQASGQGAINVFLSHLLHQRPIEIWGDGGQIRDYIPVQDAAAAIRTVALSHEKGFDVFNIGTGEGKSLRDVLDAVSSVTGMKPNVRFSEPRQFDVPINVLDCSHVRQTHGWTPAIPFDQALRETWAWTQKYG